jgi:hypothetical protein
MNEFISENMPTKEEKTHTESVLIRLEESLGGKFLEYPTVEYKDLTAKDEELNPEGVYGSYGTFDYQKRTVYLDKTRIEKSEYTEEEVRDHEFVHILEQDLIGTEPIHGHLVHSVLFGKREQERILGMIGTITDKRVQKILWGHEVELNLVLEEDALKKIIQKTEDSIPSLLKGKEPKTIERNRVIASLVAMNLNDLKIAYFSLCLKNAKEAVVFEKAVQALHPKKTLLGNIKMMKFDEEITIMKEIQEKNKIKEEKSL